MPIYELDGKQYSLPDDVTHDEALKFISSQVGSASSQQPVPSSEQPNVAQQPKPNTGYLGNIDNAMTAHENSVGQQLTQPEKYPGQHVLQTINGVLSYPGVVAGAALSPLKPLAKGIIEGNAFAGGSNANANGLGQSIATMTQPIAQAAQKYPAVQAGLDVGQAGVNIASLLTGGAATKEIPGIMEKEIPSTIKTVSKAINPSVDDIIQKGIDKGIKPTNIPNNDLNSFSQKANTAVKTIAENKDALNLIDSEGKPITRPRSNAEMAQAIAQTKQNIYQKYTDMAKSAGDDKVASFEAAPIISQLNKIAQAPDEILPTNDPRLKYSQATRLYANSLKSEIGELNGASPEIVQSRIQDLNNSLAGYYDGRVAKSTAAVDASVAQAIRTQLDSKIENAVGPGYQDLKNQYGSLKSVEDAVNHRALIQARSASKNVFDLTDVFTGMKLVGGIASMNPAMIAEAGAGKVIKEVYKKMNNPDRYIDNMFQAAYNEADKNAANIANTGAKELPGVQLPSDVNIPTFWRQGGNPVTFDAGGNYANDKAKRIGAIISEKSPSMGVPLSRLRK